MTTAQIAKTAGDGLAYGIQPLNALTGVEEVLVTQGHGLVSAPLNQLNWVGTPAITLQVAKAAISRQQITTLGTTPVPVIPAPGPGKIIVPVFASLFYTAGSGRFALSDFSGAYLGLMGGAGQYQVVVFANIQTLTASQVVPGSLSNGKLADLINAPLLLGGTKDPGVWGPITSAAVGAAGTGYAVGDTGTLSGGSADATYQVTSIGANGAITGFTLTNPGTSYVTMSLANTARAGTQAGAGINFKAAIGVSTATTGTAEVLALYYVTDAMT